MINKYIVTRTDGRENSEEEYFVLRVDKNTKNKEASLMALRLYAKAISVDNPKLSEYISTKYDLNYESITDEALYLHNQKMLKRIEFLFDCSTKLFEFIETKTEQDILHKEYMKNNEKKIEEFGQYQGFEIFDNTTINLDFKDLRIIQSSLELQIKEISIVNFDDSHTDYIQVHEDLLNRIDKKLREFD